MDEFLTVNEVAEQLNPQTMRNWIDQDELAAVRVGRRRVRVRQSDLDAFLAAGEAVGERPTASDEVPAEGADQATARWAELGEALAASIAALSGDDRAELVRALEALAVAASSLAEAIRTGTSACTRIV